MLLPGNGASVTGGKSRVESTTPRERTLFVRQADERVQELDFFFVNKYGGGVDEVIEMKGRDAKIQDAQKIENIIKEA